MAKSKQVAKSSSFLEIKMAFLVLVKDQQFKDHQEALIEMKLAQVQQFKDHQDTLIELKMSYCSTIHFIHSWHAVALFEERKKLRQHLCNERQTQNVL